MELKVQEFKDKKELYETAVGQITAITAGTDDMVAILSNASALLNFLLQDINWVGFYLYQNGALVLGPFQGKPAVTVIRGGEGVCGTCLQEQKIQIVEDVHKCTNHIACDLASMSEIVLPIKKDGRLIGVLDIDSPVKARFDAGDAEGLSAFIEKLVPAFTVSPAYSSFEA